MFKTNLDWPNRLPVQRVVLVPPVARASKDYYDVDIIGVLLEAKVIDTRYLVLPNALRIALV